MILLIIIKGTLMYIVAVRYTKTAMLTINKTPQRLVNNLLASNNFLNENFIFCKKK